MATKTATKTATELVRIEAIVAHAEDSVRLWGVMFTREDDALIAHVDLELANQMLEAGRVKVI